MKRWLDKDNMNRTITLLAVLAASLNAPARAQAPAAPAQARPPAWAGKGAYVFRVSTPDEADVLRPQLEEGHAIVANLLGRHCPADHDCQRIDWPRSPGGLELGRPVALLESRRRSGRGVSEKLAEFMLRVEELERLHRVPSQFDRREHRPARLPRVGEFFQKLVETRSIYRRDWNKASNKRDGEPFTPTEIEKYADDRKHPDPVQIFALVNYKRFWDSGLAKR